MTPEEQLRNRIVALSTGVLNRLPLKAFTRQLGPLVVPFADEIADMARQYHEAKKKEEHALRKQESSTQVRSPDGELGRDDQTS